MNCCDNSPAGQTTNRGATMTRKRTLVGRIEQLECRHALAVDVVTALPDVTVAPNAAAAIISLANRYDDTDVTGSVVRFEVNSPSPLDRVFVELFDQAGPGRTRVTPVTAANFLRYVDAGAYTNTFIHRSVPGFVVQGGGFTVSGTTSFAISDTTSFGTIVNEPGTVGSTNVRGTIAMAKLGGDPNSASNQWFFNLSDNTDRFNPNSLDNQNGGFTTFGRVLGSGMAAVDVIAAVPRFGYSSPYDSIPLRGVPGANASTLNAPPQTGPTAEQFVKFPSIVRVGELLYSVTTNSPALVTPTIETNGNLKLTYAPGGMGTAVVTVRATSVFDATRFVEDAFTVRVAPPGVVPNAIVGLAGNALVISRSTGTGFATGPLATLPAGTTWLATVAGDFNADGRTDVATQAANGGWWVTLTPATGTTAAPTLWATQRTDITWQFPTVGDFNGDGRADIAVRNGTSGLWRILASSGATFTASQFGTWPADVQWQNVRGGDFNGDGKTDLVGQRTSDGAWWVSTSTGSAFTTSTWGVLRTNVAWQFPTVGDFNGDGKSDIAVRNGTSGLWRILASTGATFNSLSFGTWPADVQWQNARGGDFNGDGKTDLVGQRTGDGAWWVSLSTGSAFTTSTWGVLRTNVAWQFATVGDFNLDGKSDVAVRNGTSGIWRVLASTGSAFTNLDFGTWPSNLVWSSAVGVRS
ncbi:MAG: FG-GAP-like repeat-containing protein [Pirellulales bacterium]